MTDLRSDLFEQITERFLADFTSEMLFIYGANFSLEIASILDEFHVDYYGAILTEYRSNFGMKMSEFQNANERFSILKAAVFDITVKCF